MVAIASVGWSQFDNFNFFNSKFDTLLNTYIELEYIYIEYVLYILHKV